jgi:hypothetical protein
MNDESARRVSRVSAGIVGVLVVFGAGMFVSARELPPVPQLRELEDTYESLFGAKKQEEEEWWATPSQDGEPVQTLLPDEVAPGLRLVSTAQPDEMLLQVMDRDGNLVHSWTPDFDEVWPEGYRDFPPRVATADHIFGLELLPDASIVANFAQQSTFRMDVCGEVMWRLPNLGHHSIDVAPDGTLWVPGENYIPADGEVDIPNAEPPFHDWTITNLSLDGELLRSYSVVDILRDNGLESLLYLSARNRGAPSITYDPLHLNSVKALPEGVRSRLFEPGDLAVSLRNISTLLVLDGDTMKVKWHTTGPFLRQHDPIFLPRDRISLFDNRPVADDGGSLESQIMELNTRTGEATVVLGGDGPGEEPFYSEIMGDHEYLPNGNILVTPSDEGRVLEYTPDGRLAWSWQSRLDNETNARTFEASVLPASMDREFFEEKLAACAN